MDPHFTNFLDMMVRLEKPLDIKKETPEHTSSLISPPITPSPPSFISLSVPSTTSRRRGSISSLAGPKRSRPYPSVNRDTRSRKEDLDTMSNNTTYGTWNTSGGRSGLGRHHPTERRSSDVEDRTPYGLPTQFMESFMPNPSDQPNLRTTPSSSSLTGAMGNANLSSHSRHSHSPSSSNSGHAYADTLQSHGLAWDTPPQMNMTIAMNDPVYPGVAGHGGLFSGMNQLDLDISLNEYTTTRNVSPESASSHSPNQTREYPGAYGAASRGHLSPQQGGGATGYPRSSLNTYSTSPEDKDEVARLQRRIRELELECGRTKIAMQSMKAGGLPGAPQSPAFQASWRNRTEIRKKLLCSLNRAGNALCSWHDSRRERRTYAPRLAPPGYLNCGCTFEEALFEESLSRHGVGAYHPGDTVRMDPVLRNALLKLLKKRYGYKDGDFEHDPFNETWFSGESPAEWEQKAQSGQTIKRRPDADRH